MNAADTAWIIVATALVLFMTLPGLALFYGGLVRARNVLSVFMQCFGIACLMSILWLVAGYSIAFGDGNAYWGGLGKAFLSGVDEETMAGNIPEVLFFAFQMTFAIITPALIVGAYVERIRFGFVMLFSALWMLICYAPVAHWVWGGGLLAGGEGALFAEGVNDFAGGIVVHQTAGIAALIVAAFLGGRRDKGKPPHNPGMVMIGAAMLWVGWFGFNGGSELAANGSAAMALTVTHLSAATASLTWILWERIRYGKTSLVGLVTGTIAGLASITPASGSVGPVEALIIGGVAGILCQELCGIVKNTLNIDDTLDVFAVHGVGGMFGIIMLAVFGYADWTAQLGGLAVVGIWTIVTTTVIVLVAKAVFPIRVSEEDEHTGLDLTSHGERAYDMSS
ncbi:ammonium transporter [Pseudooctadecabacter jejudonensis]|uniref:Ammonium transporter n=1 Tax=Pseudooctadecabacter jejudonensis TaxID=1391910 RepID=A0A1Y5RER1_9RHOB|nr:ammonium transporter [Pseudooctadecabacter jejudonensis]SLN15734.1 Ammonia channel precursor [Pseudooctadecabacter jejudonensis]